MSLMVKVLRWRGKEHVVAECCQCHGERPLSGYRGKRVGGLLGDWCLDCLVALRKEVEQAETELYAAKCGGGYGEKPAPPEKQESLGQVIQRFSGSSGSINRPAFRPVINPADPYGIGLPGPAGPPDPADPTGGYGGIGLAPVTQAPSPTIQEVVIATGPGWMISRRPDGTKVLREAGRAVDEYGRSVKIEILDPSYADGVLGRRK